MKDKQPTSGHNWREVRKYKRKRGQEVRALNLAALQASGVTFEVRHELALLREPGKPRIDFFLTTGRWRDLDTAQMLRGGAVPFLAWYATQTSTRE